MHALLGFDIFLLLEALFFIRISYVYNKRKNFKHFKVRLWELDNCNVKHLCLGLHSDHEQKEFVITFVNVFVMWAN